MKQLYVKTRDQWRKWLTNHQHEEGVWLIYYKKTTSKPSLDYAASVEEALCFGWIDSIIKKIDAQRYARKFTPRKSQSRWSEINKKRAEKMMARQRMTPSGLARIREAKKQGFWDNSDRPQISLALPLAFRQVLQKNKKAHNFFLQLAPSYQKQFIGWISVAKREETRTRRIRESIALLNQGEKLGMK